jgi:2-polyprenyl-6-methoxyphenol hydroxylase-like FAD-dependent oxidoreductase
MQVSTSKIAIVGGSIAGCAAAIALGRAGADVHVFERSGSALKDRGSGIAIPTVLRDQLVAADYLPSDYPCCVATRRWWTLEDGTPGGKIAWDQTGSGVTNNWGVLWRSLRQRVDDRLYHDGCSLRGISEDDDGVELTFGDGQVKRFDLVVGADGYRSTVRIALHPESKPQFAGYLMWRGTYKESRVVDRGLIDRMDAAQAVLGCLFEGGHGVLYMIPDFDDRVEPGCRCVNWVIYTSTPAGLDFQDPTSLPPGSVPPELYAHLEGIVARHYPPEQQALIRLSPIDEVSIQPIYDQLAASFVGRRSLLIGDAAAITRPHTGSGATKALQDALALERIAKAAPDLQTMLKQYDEERFAAGRSLVEMGRRIGKAQVEHTPDWGSMSPSDFDRWIAATLAGAQLYLFDTPKRETT